MNTFKKRFGVLLGFIVILALFVTLIFVFHENEKQNENQSELQKISNVKIAVIDGPKLKAKAKCFKAHEKIAQLLSDVFVNMKQTEANLKAKGAKIKANKNYSDKQKNKELAILETEYLKMANKYNSEIQVIRKKDLLLTDYINERLNNLLAKISKTANLQLIMNKGTADSMFVFYNSANIDITNLIIKKLDETLPDIQLEDVEK